MASASGTEKKTRKSTAPAAEAPVDIAAAPHLPPNLEAWKPRVVHRSEVKGAPYNPRIMSDDARRRLRASLEKLGVLAPPTWNVRTGLLVGGHQRMTALDAIMGTDNYRLTVAEVDLSEADERAANLVLNNENAMGDWDLDKLAAMLDPDPSFLAASGFDALDLRLVLGNDGLAERAPELADELAERVAAARDRQTTIEEKSANRDSPDYYLVLVFSGFDARERFMARLALPAPPGRRVDLLGDGRSLDGRFLDGERLATALEARGALPGELPDGGAASGSGGG